MKRTLAAALAAAMLLAGLSGCGAKPQAPAPAEDTPAPTQAVEPVGDFYPGTASGNVYESQFLHLRFTAPEGWSFADANTLGQLMGASGAVTDYEKYGTVYDMSAASQTGGSYVRIGLENLSAEEDGSAVTEEAYAAGLQESLQAIGVYESTFAPLAKAEVAGAEYTLLASTVGKTGSYQDFLIRRVGDYILCITLSGIGDSSQPMWQCFSALEQ